MICRRIKKQKNSKKGRYKKDLPDYPVDPKELVKRMFNKANSKFKSKFVLKNLKIRELFSSSSFLYNPSPHKIVTLSTKT